MLRCLFESLGRRMVALVALLALSLGALAQPDKPAAAASMTLTGPTPVPVADFFRKPAMARPRLSPSGRHLAVHLAGPDGRVKLAVLSVDPPREARVVAGFSDTDINDVDWVNDDRLVFDVSDSNEALAHRKGNGLFAVDRDGSSLRMLVRREWRILTNPVAGARQAELTPNHWLDRTLRDGSADVLVQRQDTDASRIEPIGNTLLRLDTRTGRVRSVDSAWTRQAWSWAADARGEPRALVHQNGDQYEVWWRSGKGADWALIDRGPLFRPGADGLERVFVGPDNLLYAVAPDRKPAGTSALFRLDAASGKREAEPLVRVDGFDFDGQLIADGRDNSLTGVHYRGDAWSTVWLAPAMQAVQQGIDKQLPGLVNLIDIAECGCSRWMVVTSYSDRQPAMYWLYDREADRLEPVGQAQPQIDPKRMARQDFVRFNARDGLSIPLHVTRPAGKGPWPTVVLVHGGPHVRGASWEWDNEAQFLASRGYLVLQPEFRGSEGYGSRLFRAGWKQWGLKSQDDMNDALAWAVARGDADPGRACIAGGSYGGYAALMGLIRDPTLWRCGLAWMAVTDINLMFTLQHSDLSEVWRRHGMPHLIGDPVADAAQLAATSPLQQAARLKRPLLMAAGGVDERVPIAHATRFRDALPEGYTGLTWLVYPDEGHGLYKPANRQAFWTQVETFLARELAPR